jgi:succinoglycan biosynthesis protein ExoV
MDLCYFKSEERNFGDDLNPYILEHFIPNYKDQYEDIVIYFIGTILFDGFVGEKKIKDFAEKRKVILGSGVRFINNPPYMDATWDVRFLRGPLSSLALTNNCNTYITDPAYLVRELPVFTELPKIKKHKISLMPHFLSLDKIDWKKLCDKYEINFIIPSEKNVDFILSEIAQSDVLITEAMHGAIIADAFRVPWKRFKWFSHVYESEMVSEFKWSDWLFSMNLKHSFYSLPYNKVVKEIDKRFNVPFMKYIRNKDADKSFENLIKDGTYQLSADKILDEKMNRLNEEMLLLKKQFNKESL